MSQREIRFRAWDKEHKGMVGLGTLDEIAMLGSIYKKLLTEVFEPMQFTGLQDKNGNDVYEGDIIREDDGNVWPIEFAYFGSTGYDLGVDDEGKFEVIGNIYEHPNLLK